MRRYTSSSHPRKRAAIVGALIALGVLVPMGVGYAAPEDGSEADTGTSQRSDQSGEKKSDGTCADGNRDTDPRDGVCSRDAADRQDATEAKNGEGEATSDRKGDNTTCADGNRDTDPRDGMCSRDAADRQDATEAKDGEATSDRKGDDTRCADGNRDTDPRDGMCSRDAAGQKDAAGSE